MASTSPSMSASTLPTSMASDTDKIPIIQFVNTKALAEAIMQIQGDFAIVENVTPADSENLLLQEERPFRIRQYYADTGILFITIPTELHEALHRGIWNGFRDKLVVKGQQKGWKELASTTFTLQSHPGGNGKEGDSTGGPNPGRELKGSWPTLAIESGVSQSLPQLQRDMRWWFSASDHQVKIVLLAKFNHLNQSIIIERWEEEPPNPQSRQGATNPRQALSDNTLQPVLRQSIVITRDATTDSYHITSGALVLSFRLLFLRDPGTNEGDIIISIAELQDYARVVWLSV